MDKLKQIDVLHNQGFNDMKISRLVKSHKLGNLGYGFYIDNPQHFDLEKDAVIKITNTLLNSFPNKPNRVLFSSTSLNNYINQLISSTTYIVEVEKEYIQTVFELLKSKLKNKVLLKPNDDDKHNYWEPGVIYLVELYKRCPVSKDGSIKVETLLVNLLCNKHYYSLYSGQDIESIINTICLNYTIDYKTLISYASRRNKKEDVLNVLSKYIPQEILEVIKVNK